LRVQKLIELADANQWWEYTIDLRRLKPILLNLQGGRCALCGESLSLQNSTIEHVFSKMKRIRNNVNANVHNVLVAHERCNRDKGDADPSAEEVALLTRVNAEINFLRRSTKSGGVVHNDELNRRAR
jgi:5-methylcytosine-specific restriction endonuclease McrA